MTARTDSSLRGELIDAAAALIAKEGTAALTLRRLAAEVGTSTMAIYTHFGGMEPLRRAIREEGFARLAARLAEVDPRAEPLDRLVELCFAYREWGVRNPDLYRAMFMEQALEAEEAAACASTFEALVGAVRSCEEEKLLAGGGPTEARASELWVAGHGVVTLRIAGLLSEEQASGCAAAVVAHLLNAFGADDAAVRGALARASA